MSEQVDYWSKLKLNECWNDKQRFNIMMTAIHEKINEANNDGEQGVIMSEQVDYWSKLQVNECWSEKQRFNFIMNKIDELNGEND